MLTSLPASRLESMTNSQLNAIYQIYAIKRFSWMNRCININLFRIDLFDCERGDRLKVINLNKSAIFCFAIKTSLSIHLAMENNKFFRKK